MESEKQIEVSQHGAERLIERLASKRRKHHKIVRKAWHSKEKSNRLVKKKLLRWNVEYILRTFLGYIWVFSEKDDRIVFITVINTKIVDEYSTKHAKDNYDDSGDILKL